MISDTDFLNFIMAYASIMISDCTILLVLCFPSQAISIIAISMVATWIFPVIVVIGSPDISRSNYTVEVFGNLFLLELMSEFVVWHLNSSTSPFEVGVFAGLGRMLLIWTGGLLFFNFSMKVAYKANPDTRELDAILFSPDIFDCPEVVRQCLRALRIHRQPVSIPEYQFLPQEEPHNFPSEFKSRSPDETDSIASPRIFNFVS